MRAQSISGPKGARVSKAAPTRAHDLGTRLFAASAVVGILHAVPSLYWALGGSALVSTVGEWAQAWRQESPTQVTVVLLVVFAVKIAGAVVPLVNHLRPLPATRVWRAVAWLGSALLIIYGGVNTLAAMATLAGLIGESADQDRMGLIGHAFLWDPLFLLWGILLGLALATTRPRHT